MMLAAPLALTLGLGLATGSFSGGDDNTGIQDIPVVLVNEDEGELGSILVDTFQSAELADLMAPTISADLNTAKTQVDDDEIAAVVIVPAGFTASVIPDEAGNVAEAVSIEVYSNPARPISSGIVQIYRHWIC